MLSKMQALQGSVARLAQFSRAFSTSRSSLSTVAKVTLIGRLAKEPVVSQTKTGKPYLRYTVVTSEKIGDVETPTFHRLSMFGEKAENDYLRSLPKGTLVHCEADYTTKEERREDGSYNQTVYLNLAKINVLAKPRLVETSAAESIASA